MNEVLSDEAPSSVEVEDQSDVFGNKLNEANTDKQAFPRLDGELFPLVAANADVIAACSWMGGEKVTLTAAMCNYQKPMTEENVDEVISDVYDFLAHRITESEETEEKDEIEEEESDNQEEKPVKNVEKDQYQPKKPALIEKTPPKSDAKNIVQKTPVIPNSAKVESQLEEFQELTPAAEQPGAPDKKAKIVSAPEKSETATQAVPAPSQNEPEKPAHEVAKAETSASPAADLTEKAVVDAPRAAIAAPAVEAASEPRLESITNEPKSATVDYEPRAVSETPALGLSDEIEAADGPEPTEPFVADIQDIIVADETITWADEQFEAIEDKPALTVVEYPIEPGEIIDFAEDEAVKLDHYEAPAEPYEPYDLTVAQTGQDDLETAEAVIVPEQVLPPSVSVEAIEASLIQLSEQMTVCEPETAQAVDEILEMIIDVPAKLETGDEAAFTEAEAQQELEELFSALFDRLGVDCTPELIEGLVRLTMEWRVADEIENLKSEEKTDETPTDYGTHEIIKKLLMWLSALKKSAANAWAIGKSALRLYSLSLNT